MLRSVNPVFITALLSWFGAQFIKTILNGLLKKSLRNPADVIASLIWRTGGMPSSHSALVTALAVSIGFNEGINSTMFALALFFALVVVRDALGVRLSTGRQAQALNRLGRSLEHQEGVDFAPVKEVHGHTPPEVLAGVILGGSIALAASILSR